MTTEKHKAALDWFNHVVQHINWRDFKGQVDGSSDPINNLTHQSTICAALTAQAEAQPADDEVREAVERLKIGDKDWGDGLSLVYTKDIETLIRAATAPKTTDADYDGMFAPALEIAEGVFDLIITEKEHGFSSMERHKAAKYVQDKIAALRAPAAVPQEVVEALEWYANHSNWDDDVGYKPRLEDRAIGGDRGRRARKALALLQQKGG